MMMRMVRRRVAAMVMMSDGDEEWGQGSDGADGAVAAFFWWGLEQRTFLQRPTAKHDFSCRCLSGGGGRAPFLKTPSRRIAQGSEKLSLGRPADEQQADTPPTREGFYSSFCI